VRRALERAAAADLVIALFDGDMLPTVDSTTLDLVDERTLPVFSKADRLRGTAPRLAGSSPLLVSAKTGDGLDALQARVAAVLEARCAGLGDALFNRERHRVALAACAEALERALGAEEPALVAEDLRAARDALGRLVGRIDVERLLDRIFREFCIGK
jgi:tRNA modification GTPase